MGTSRQRLRRVLELVAGVALGVLIGDLLVGVIGTGVPQIAVVVALAMIVAIFLGGGAVIVSQAAASAVLVVTLVPASEGQPVNLDRFVDAAIGGLVGLGVSVLLLPVNPVSTARRALDPLLETLAELLDGSADALALSHALLEAGHFVQAIRPPTVPPGTARLRISLSAAHTREVYAAAAQALGGSEVRFHDDYANNNHIAGTTLHKMIVEGLSMPAALKEKLKPILAPKG